MNTNEQKHTPKKERHSIVDNFLVGHPWQVVILLSACVVVGALLALTIILCTK